MGYYSRLSGEIQIDPPLNYAEVRKIEALKGNYGSENIFTVETHETTTETDKGRVTTVTGDALVCRYDDSIKAYGAEEDFKEAVRALLENEHTLTGYIQMDGEEQGDISRFVVEDGQPVMKSPKIIW